MSNIGSRITKFKTASSPPKFTYLPAVTHNLSLHSKPTGIRTHAGINSAGAKLGLNAISRHCQLGNTSGRQRQKNSNQ